MTKNDNLKLIDFEHSLKNIPISNRKYFLTKIFDQTSKFINRLRWKAYFFDLQDSHDLPDTPSQDEINKLFPSRRSAPEIKDLKAFEDDLFNMIKSIKFNNFKSKYQLKLSKDIKKLLNTNMIIVRSDKTSNLYYASPQLYKKLVINNLTSEYSIAPNDPTIKINEEATQILSNYNTKNRKIPKFLKAEAFITIKDHKPNFPHNISCRTINPSKSFLGKIAKLNLQTHIDKIRSKSNLTQWLNSDEVIKWFNNINDKAHKCFINFDIKNFYPSIKKEHITKAIKFAEEYTKFNKQEINTLIHTCQTIISYDNRIWTKKSNINNFDIAMGSFQGAEVCDLIGLYILSEISPITGPLNIGLYRDDGLAVIKQSSGTSLEKIKKSLIKKMSSIGFEITIDIGNTSTEFLDISLDLLLNTYCPYRKPNSKTNYINNNSNHPKNIRNNIPKMIEKRLCKLSKNEEVFSNIKGFYQNALNKSNFKYSLTYKQFNNTNTKRNRKRNCIYYNPPFCKSVQTKIGKHFIELIDKHFPKDNIYHKIFNRNSIKISYCCTPNIMALINSHNKKLMKKPDKKENLCNCRSKTNCPVENKCCQNNVIYQAKVSTSKDDYKVYIGSTKRSFKSRYNEHKTSFPKPLKNKPKNCTQLANHLWNLYNSNVKYTIKWKIIEAIKTNSNHTNMCTLCNLERLHIALSDKRKTLNKRNELITQCPHYLNEYL